MSDNDHDSLCGCSACFIKAMGGSGDRVRIASLDRGAPLDMAAAFAHAFLHGKAGSLARGTVQEREMRKAFYSGVAWIFLWLESMDENMEEQLFALHMEALRLQLKEAGEL